MNTNIALRLVLIVKEHRGRGFAISAGASELLQIVLNEVGGCQWMTIRAFGMSRSTPNALVQMIRLISGRLFPTNLFKSCSRVHTTVISQTSTFSPNDCDG